eukprot:Rhum_TRINITY_DN25189_c0_g1::Rhum_TRINITY_DN25189_c0_g1_i1::g.181424::m.181424
MRTSRIGRLRRAVRPRRTLRPPHHAAGRVQLRVHLLPPRLVRKSRHAPVHGHRKVRQEQLHQHARRPRRRGRRRPLQGEEQQVVAGALRVAEGRLDVPELQRLEPGAVEQPVPHLRAQDPVLHTLRVRLREQQPERRAHVVSLRLQRVQRRQVVGGAQRRRLRQQPRRLLVAGRQPRDALQPRLPRASAAPQRLRLPPARLVRVRHQPAAHAGPAELGCDGKVRHEAGVGHAVVLEHDAAGDLLRLAGADGVGGVHDDDVQVDGEVGEGTVHLGRVQHVFPHLKRVQFVVDGEVDAHEVVVEARQLRGVVRFAEVDALEAVELRGLVGGGGGDRRHLFPGWCPSLLLPRQ